MRRRFFVDRFDGDSATLRGETAEHLGRVLRAEVGQLYELSDGERVWLGRIEDISIRKRGGNRIEFALVEPIAAREPSVRIQLLISLIKFDRFEWCLEKATELGVSEIVPLGAARTDKPLIAAAEKRMERWQRILTESAQQSRRLRSPSITEVIRPANAFAQSTAACKILLSERADAKPVNVTLVPGAGSSSGSSAGSITGPSASLAIGPEGGWTDDEIAAARAAGFLETSLGENILRTETAVLASLAILHFSLGT
jgi:16S rRNA (uracil1498-N3)-methyltransferase